MPRYKVHFEDGSEAGEAVYAVHIKPGDVIIAAGTQRVRVLDLVAVEEEDSPYVGLLRVEPAESARMRQELFARLKLQLRRRRAKGVDVLLEIPVLERAQELAELLANQNESRLAVVCRFPSVCATGQQRWRLVARVTAASSPSSETVSSTTA